MNVVRSDPRGGVKMDSKEFKKFCKDEFTKRGFRKVKNEFYRQGNGVLCSLHLQHSDFGSIYYINICFYIGTFADKDYPTRYDYDFCGRFSAMTKKATQMGGGHFLSSGIEYNYYTEDELRPYIEKGFEEMIYPVLEHGKKKIIPLLEQKEFIPNILRDEETLNKLKD